MEGTITLDRTGRVALLSRNLERMIGYSTDEAVGSDITFFSPDGCASEHAGIVERAVEADSPFTVDSSLKRRDGVSVDATITASPVRDRTGSLLSILLTVCVRVQPLPPVFPDEFRRIFDLSSDAVMLTDIKGTILDVNRGFTTTYGYTLEELRGNTAGVLRSKHSTNSLYEAMWHDILDPERGFWSGELINRTRDGGEVPVLLSINAVRDDLGTTRNFLGIATDLSRSKELERINKLYVDYTIHDIRGPLTTILGTTDLLSMSLDDTPADKLKRRLDIIASGARRIDAMTYDMLDYSKAQRGKLVINRSPAPFDAIMRECIVSFEHNSKSLIVNNGPAVDVELEQRMVDVDASLVQRIIYNLLTNAFKYAASEVRFDFELGAKELVLHVSDDGPGISEKDAERIFDAFYQTDEGIRAGGAGLGLSIVKTFAEAHGGRVWVEPGPGRGARFGVVIPVERRDKAGGN